MPDLKITELAALASENLAATDPIAVASLGASTTKKITAKDFVQKAVTLIDNATIPNAKVNLSGVSGTNLGDATVTVAKLNTAGIPATGGVTVSGGNLQLVAPTSPIVRNGSTGSLEHADSAVTPGTYTKLVVDAKGHITSGTTLVDADIPSPTTTPGTYTKLVVDAKGRITSGTTLTSGDIPALADTGITAGTYTKVTVDVKGRATAGTTLVAADLPIATASVVGAVSIPSSGGLALTGGGAVSHSNAVTGGASTRSGITFDAQGHIVSTVALASTDLPVATNVVKGAVIAGTGLTIDGSGVVAVNVATSSVLGGIKLGTEVILNGTNQLEFAVQGGIAGGTAYPKVTVNSKGIVTAGADLNAADIPAIDTAKITTGTFNVDRYGANTITGAKLANYATGKISEAFPTADYVSQLFFNPLERTLYMWDGNVYQPIGVSFGQVVFSGTYDAGTNLITSVTVEGAAIGLTVGGALVSPITANKAHYVVVDQPGTGTAPAPAVALSPPDMLLSNGTTWILLDVSDTVTAQLASNVQVTPAGNIASTNVQSALQELDTEKLPLAGGTLTGNLALNTGIAIVYEGATTDNFETTLYVVDPTADRTILLPNVSGTVVTTGDTGTVTSTMLLDGTILDADVNASAAIAYSKLATLSSANIVLGSSANVATSTAVTGDITIGNTGVTAIAAGVIVNADVSASAAIVDTKLDTIATALKVSNSATTAASANTASAIVARDASGNFTAGTITAALTGNASSATTAAACTGNAATVTTNANLTGDVTSTGNATAIAAGVIVNADINASAAIAGSKIVAATTSVVGAVQLTDSTSSTSITTAATPNSVKSSFDAAGVALGVADAALPKAGGTMTGALVVPLASAATPSLTFTGDLNTGIFSPGADQLAISTNGTGRLFVDAAGNVGVGITPAVDAGATELAIGSASTNPHFSGIRNGVNAFLLKSDSVSTMLFERRNLNLLFGTNNAERARIRSDGMFEVKGAGTAGSSPAFSVNGSAPANSAIIDSSGRLLVGTSTSRSTYNAGDAPKFQVESLTSGATVGITHSSDNANSSELYLAKARGSAVNSHTIVQNNDNLGILFFGGADGTNIIRAASVGAQVDGTPGVNNMPGRIVFSTNSGSPATSPTERMRITNAGHTLINTTDNDGGINGTPTKPEFSFKTGSSEGFRFSSNGVVGYTNRAGDGIIIMFRKNGTDEGSISVSGSTVSYNGAHLSRWSQFASGAERTEILRGSVLSNLDEMCEWSEEENEQLNRMKVSTVEGDKNVSGVFQAWDDDDDTYTNDFYCAMTGDFIIRIAEGVTVERGDLLMSAGDGTAKPQDDDIIRSKTIAKVTSTNVSCTYDDGSYCVPCVLMAC